MKLELKISEPKRYSKSTGRDARSTSVRPFALVLLAGVMVISAASIPTASAQSADLTQIFSSGSIGSLESGFTPNETKLRGERAEQGILEDLNGRRQAKLLPKLQLDTSESAHAREWLGAGDQAFLYESILIYEKMGRLGALSRPKNLLALICGTGSSVDVKELGYSIADMAHVQHIAVDGTRGVLHMGTENLFWSQARSIGVGFHADQESYCLAFLNVAGK